MPDTVHIGAKVTADVLVEAFGDAACPYDFAAEGARLRLRWRYGSRFQWAHRMVVLSRTADEYPARGVSLDYLVESRQRVAALSGAAIDVTRATRHIATVVACRAVVGVRRHAPERTDVFLRSLRVRGISLREMIDDPATIAACASDAGLAHADVERWASEETTARDLEADMAQARTPDPAALMMTERLAKTLDGAWRYSCPSYVLRRGGITLSAPGYQPVRVYETLLANLAPDLAPRPLPGRAEEVVRWAPYPLNTCEIATVVGSDITAVRHELTAAGVPFTPVAGDGYWSVDGGVTPSHGAGSPTTWDT